MELTKQKIKELRTKIEQKNSVFSQKRFLDTMFLPSKIIGREPESEMLLQHILSLKDGFVVPFVSIYGRSGSGKSTIVKFVCENLEDIISFRFVCEKRMLVTKTETSINIYFNKLVLKIKLK